MASTLARALCLLLLTLALCLAPSRTLAQSTEATGIVSFLQQVTTLSDNARVAALKIDFFNAPTLGFQIAVNFGTISSTISDHMAAMAPNPPPLNDADAQLVVAALVEFVKVHQALLQVVIGKHGLLTLVPFFEPIRQALVALEAGVDSVAFALIAVIPTQAPAAQVQFGSLGDTLDNAITTYSTL